MHLQKRWRDLLGRQLIPKGHSIGRPTTPAVKQIESSWGSYEASVALATLYPLALSSASTVTGCTIPFFSSTPADF
jgi:hypothetical protein